MLFVEFGDGEREVLEICVSVIRQGQEWEDIEEGVEGYFVGGGGDSNIG